jgi:Zn-dependent protease
MIPSVTESKAWPLFSFRGIQVSLHWSWVVVAIYQIQRRPGVDGGYGWAAAEYLTLFAIVLLHEFGHSLATRQVGGTADRILLWPFGGIAFVQTPPRPGAYLWAIAAGPLVNVALFPLLYFASPDLLTTTEELWVTPWEDFLHSIFMINAILLAFNLLPVFPLDGGQLFRGLLWYKLGARLSLKIAAWSGLILAVGGMAAAVYYDMGWMAIMIGLLAFQCWQTLRAIRRYEHPVRAVDAEPSA